MSHRIEYDVYHCSTSEKQIMKDLNRFAYDPQESSGYHGNMTFHKEPVYKTRGEALDAISKFDRGWYDDHSVIYWEKGKKYYLVKVEWHC